MDYSEVNDENYQEILHKCIENLRTALSALSEVYTYEKVKDCSKEGG